MEPSFHIILIALIVLVITVLIGRAIGSWMLRINEIIDRLDSIIDIIDPDEDDE